MIKNYMAGIAPKHQYVIKIVNFDKKSAKEIVERFMSDYTILDLDVKETPIQRSPLDFEKFVNSSVVIINVSTAYPVSADYARELLCREAMIPASMIIVRHKESPLEAQNNLNLLRTKLGTGNSLLSCDSSYREDEQTPDGSTYVGNTYTSKLLQVMDKLRKEKPTVHEIDAPSPLFSWLDMHKVQSGEPQQDTTDMNSGLHPKAGKMAPTLNSGALGN